jgi:hypothetical protein
MWKLIVTGVEEDKSKLSFRSVARMGLLKLYSVRAMEEQMRKEDRGIYSVVSEDDLTIDFS